jgi:hypothetical protein
MTQNVKSLDDLILGVKQILSEDRCSFSDEEKVLLDECVFNLQLMKKTKDDSGKPNLGLFAESMEFLIKVMTIADHLKDFF